VRRVFFYGSLFFCMFIAPAAIAHAGGEGSDRTGLLSGVLKKVESSESVEDVVGSAAEGADQTVHDDVSFSKDTVGTLVDPATERAITEIVEHTVDFVEGTVEKITPVVKNSTETVQTATSEVTGIVEELPKVPVVIPVLDEVSTVVNETTKTVSDSVGDVEVDETVDSFEKITKTSRLPQEKETPIINEQHDEVIGQPVFDSNKDNDMVSIIDSPEVLESIETIVDGETNFIPNEDLQETAGRSVNQVPKVAMTKEETTATEETPEIPVQSSTQWDGIPIAVTTGTTSVLSPPVSHGGNADFVPGIVVGMAILYNLSGRQWVHSDENMRVQWVHAPPGQPPQLTPFLQAKK